MQFIYLLTKPTSLTESDICAKLDALRLYQNDRWDKWTTAAIKISPTRGVQNKTYFMFRANRQRRVLSIDCQATTSQHISSPVQSGAK